MKIFYFPKCELKYLLFLLFFIFSFLQNLIIRWISMDSKDVAQPFLNTYLFNISDYIAIIPYLIVIIRSRKLNIEKIKAGRHDTYHYIHNEGEAKKKYFIWKVIAVGVFDFLSHASSLAFYLVYDKNERSVSENNLSSLLIFNTITIYLLSRLILKTYFYKHHYFSFLINIISILILGTIDIVNIINDRKDESVGMIIFYIIKKILTIIFYSVEDVIGKKVLMDEFISIYALLLYRAIFETICLILFSIPFCFIKITDGFTGEEEIIYYRINNLFATLNAIKIIIFVFINLFYNIFIWMIIDKFSPSHYAISNIFESFGTLIRLWITEPEQVKLPVLRMFIFFILIFASLIHTEIIVINYCDLQKNTKLFLEEIEKADIQLIKSGFDNDNAHSRSDSFDSSNSDININKAKANDKEENYIIMESL